MNLTFTQSKISMEDGLWLCLKVNETAPAREFVLKKQNKLYDCKIKQHRDKRSMNANDYCWVLLDKMADALHTTKEELYIQKVREVGPFKDFTLTEDEANTFRVAWELLGTGWPTEQVGYDKDGDGDIDVDDLHLLTREDVVKRVLKPHYWDRWKADDIKSQSVANILVDWVWASGAHGIKIPQRLLGVTVDGIVGPKTIAAVNARNPRELFDQIKIARFDFIEDICKKRPANNKFKRGWMNRINDLRFEE